MNRANSRRVSAGVAAVVFSLSMVATRSFADVSPEAASGPGVLAASLPDYSYFTADVAASAPGRALAVYQHGFNVELWDFEQAVMVGVDGSTTRRIGAAETSDGGPLQGDNQPMALSPDGRWVAIGDRTAGSGAVSLLSFANAAVTRHSADGVRGFTPLAWSPDSQHVLLTAAGDADPMAFDSRSSGDAWLLDVESGNLTSMGIEGVSAAAFSPSNSEIALERGRSVDIVGMDGSLVRSIDLPRKQKLNGPNAWSPDGDLLALMVGNHNQCSWPDGAGAEKIYDDCVDGIEALTFIRADGSSGDTPEPIRADIAGNGDVLGWLSPQKVLVMDNVVRVDDDDQSNYFVNAARLDGSDPRRLSSITEYNSYGVGGFQMASALVPDLAFVDNAGSINRGPWPLWASIPTSLALALAVLTSTRVAPRLAPWRRRKLAAEPQRP